MLREGSQSFTVIFYQLLEDIFLYWKHASLEVREMSCTNLCTVRKSINVDNGIFNIINSSYATSKKYFHEGLTIKQK